MKTNENDRRVRRTRQLLHEALISLILEKPYHTISVQDILDRADVGRSTFYAHFRDKDDLFLYGVDRMLDALSQHMSQPDPDQAGSPIFPSLALFRHVQENQHLYHALIRGQGLNIFLKYGQTALSERIERHLAQYGAEQGEPAIPVPVLSYYLAGAFITLLQWWLDNKMPYPPERMDEIYRQLTLPGVMAAL